MIRSRIFWAQRSLHSVARLLLIPVVVVLLCIEIGFIVASGEFTRHDLLAVSLYAGIVAFAWHPMTAAFIVMLISSVGVVCTGSAGDLLELSMTLGLVSATCVPWVLATHVVLLSALTTYVAISGHALAQGGIYGIAGIGAIALLGGVAFRLVATRETVLVDERNRVAKGLEAIAREEQERVADELHDGIAHDLTLVLFHARALPRQPDEAARQVSLTAIEQSAERALYGIESLLSLMRDATEGGLLARPTRYDGDVIKAASSLGALLTDAGIASRVSVPHTPLDLTQEAEQLLTETAIEAVTNIIKHAPSSQSARIAIHPRSDAAELELVVENLGELATQRQHVPSGGRGLVRAWQRLARIGGRLESAPTDGGWVLRATAPSNGNG